MDLSRVESIAESDLSVEKKVESKSSKKGFAGKLADEAKSFAQKLSFGFGSSLTEEKEKVLLSKEDISPQAHVKEDGKESAIPLDTFQERNGNGIDIGTIEGEMQSSAIDKVKNDKNLLSTLESNAESKAEME